MGQVFKIHEFPFQTLFQVIGNLFVAIVGKQLLKFEIEISTDKKLLSNIVKIIFSLIFNIKSKNFLF